MSDNFSIILSRTDSIGDVVLTLPMAGLLKSRFPGCRIIFLGRAYTKDVVALSRHVDEFVNYDDIEKAPEKNAVSLLKDIKADIFLHVFPRAAIALLAKKAGIPLRAGTTNRLYHWIFCNKLIPLSRKNSSLHEAQLNIRLLEFLGVKEILPLDRLPDFFGTTNVPELSEPLKALIHKDKINVILHPKSRGSAREWGLDNFSRLINMLPPDKVRIFVSGTAQDKEQMTGFLQANRQAHDITGQLSLGQFIAFIHHCDALVAASTGPLHIAAALGKKAIGVFSPKRPIHPGRWQPLGKNASALIYDENCKNCAQGKDCDCIQKISPAQIVDLLLK